MAEAIVSASSVNVRSGPSTSKKLLGRMNRGESFSYSSDQNGWLQTNYQGKNAYVCKKYTTTQSSSVSTSVPETKPSTDPVESTTSNPTASSTSVNINVSAAVSYNKKRGYSKDKWKKIQTKVGATADGSPGAKTATAIAEWQKANGLQVDGKCGPGTLAAMNLEGSASTTSPAPSPSTSPETSPATTPSWSGENLLNGTQVSSAIQYNIKQNLASVWKDIQSVVGVAQTGNIDEVSIQAIAVWQRDNGLGADGKFGKKSQTKAGIEPPSNSGSTEFGTVGSGGLMYASNKYVRENSASQRYAKEIVDLQTGKRFTVNWKAPSGNYHSDCTPNDKASTDTIKNIVNPSKSPDNYSYWSKGSSWNWKGHPGALKLDNGVWVSCGFHLRPHGSPLGGNPDKPWNKSSPKSRPANYQSADDWKPGGHFCLYYSASNDGGTNSCRDAAELAKNMKAPD